MSKFLESLGFDTPVINFLDAAASKVAGDAALKRTFLELAGDWVAGSIPDAPAATESEITALIAVAGYPKMFAAHRAREIPDSISVATARDLQRWITRPESAGGKWEFRHLRWLRSHVHHMLLEIGRLQFIALPFGSPYRVFQAKSSIQKTMVFPEDGLECSRDGWLEKSGDGFITSYLSTPEELRSHPVDPASGQISRETESLPACDYDLRLSKESIALHVHIPSGQPLTLSDCADSFRRAENIYRRHFPEFDWRAFCCTSWLLDRELWQCLPPHSNIQSFGNLFFPLATPGNNSDQLMERVLEGTTDWRTLTPKTSLQKAVLKHLHEGHRFRTTSGFILRTSELESALNAQLGSPNLSEKMKPLQTPIKNFMKLGIIGFGGRMNSMVNTLLKAEPQLTVVGFVDTAPEAALARVPEKDRGSVGVFQTIGEMVEATRPDALAIGSRCDSHARLAIEASVFGLPLFLEKPVATRMEDALALEEAFRSDPCPVLVSFPLRASLVCQQAKRLLDLKTAGGIEHLLAVNYVPYGKNYFDMWYRDYSVTQGLFIQKATHDFDYLAFLAGAPITRVAAMSSCGRVHQDTSSKQEPPNPDVQYFEGIGFPETGMNEDSSSALLEFANGAKGVYTQVFFSKRGPKRGAVVSGLQGMVEFDFYTGEIRGTRHREPVNTLVTIEGKEAHFGGDARLAENFLAMVRDGAPSLAPLRTGLQSVYACLAAKASAELGHFIDVRQV